MAQTGRLQAVVDYSSPGAADELSPPLRRAWNDTIARNHRDALEEFAKVPDAGRFVSAQPLLGMPAPTTWTPVPRQLVSCLGRSRARAVCDADELPTASPGQVLAGGREWQNEYCEYRVLRRCDASGTLRPKRVEITTELREYWLCLAVEDPQRVLSLAREVLCDETVGLLDLFGCDPSELTPAERESAFVAYTAGSAVRNPTLRQAPRGRCNRERALFMCHPINGLDDLFFITLFGGQPFARHSGGAVVPVPLMWIFSANPGFTDSQDRRQLRDTYCRHADPAAAGVAYAAAFAGSRVALADPPGVYLRREDFDASALRYRSRPIAERGWVRWRRPDAGDRHQRVEVGPGDDEDAFLDDIQICRGLTAVPLTGGFQLLELLSVGPQLVAEAPRLPVPERRLLDPPTSDIRCGSHDSDICTQLRALLGTG